MLRTKDILDEKDPRVRAKNTDVDFPLNDEYKDIIPEMLKHLRYSQIEKLSKKYDLRPGMGLAAPQLGINKNFFVVYYEFTYTLKGTTNNKINDIDDVLSYFSFNNAIRSDNRLKVLLEVKETDKLGMGQIQEDICKNK